jgi:hypothetical protein
MTQMYADKTRNQKLETRDQRPEIRDQKVNGHFWFWFLVLSAYICVICG